MVSRVPAKLLAARDERASCLGEENPVSQPRGCAQYTRRKTNKFYLYINPIPYRSLHVTNANKPTAAQAQPRRNPTPQESSPPIPIPSPLHCAAQPPTSREHLQGFPPCSLLETYRPPRREGGQDPTQGNGGEAAGFTLPSVGAAPAAFDRSPWPAGRGRTRS